MQLMLPIRNRQIVQVVTITEEQTKGVVARLTSAKQRVGELRCARLIQADDFSVERCVLGTALQRKSKDSEPART